jgi:hypothetical protein
MDKENVEHTMECYSTFKKKGILSFTTTWMNLEGVILSEQSQTQKETYWALRGRE